MKRYLKFAPAFFACLLAFPFALVVYVAAELWELLIVELLVPMVSHVFAFIEYRAFKPMTRWAKQKRREFDAAAKPAGGG